MWALLPRRVQVLVIVLAAFVLKEALDAVYSAFTGTPAGPYAWSSLIATILVSGGAVAFNRYWRDLWRRFPQLNRWVFPDLNGVWTGKLVSTWVNPDTKASPPPIDTAITIRLSLFGVSVVLKTGESTSISSREFLQAFRETGRYRIWYAYQNTPKAQVGHRSGPHDGMAWLEVDFDDKPNRLEGLYYTSRKTTGDIDVTRQDGHQMRR